MPRQKLKRTLPGDPGTTAPDIARILRVNHAGEYGAKQIYRGQLAVLGKDPETGPLLTHMAKQEEKHLSFFEQEIVRRQTRPSALTPLWHVAGYALGYVTAKLGKEAAMACTVAVEDVISGHYGRQLNELKNVKAEKALAEKIAKFKAEEEEHHNTGMENNAEQAPGYTLLSEAIKAGSRAAIWIAKRI